MNKFLIALIACNGIAIAVCIFAAASVLSTAAAPTLLQFAQDHYMALRGSTLLMILASIALVLIKRRPGV
jgi:hypothetical protein